MRVGKAGIGKRNSDQDSELSGEPTELFPPLHLGFTGEIVMPGGLIEISCADAFPISVDEKYNASRTENYSAIIKLRSSP